MTNDLHSPSSPPADAQFGVDRNLIRYGSIFLLVVGTFGNIISFIIFTHGTLRKSSTFRYLALLSLMDLVVLYSGLLDLFLTIEYGTGFSLRSLNPITCRLHTFVTYWSQHSSSWILSFISVDRAIATNFIRFARKFCLPRSAEYIVGIIVIIVALLNCHELIYLRLQTSDPFEYSTSQTSTDYHQFTTLSPFRASHSLSTQISVLANGFELSNKQKRTMDDNDESFFSLSLCDNPQWNFLCSRNKRDISLLPSSNRDLTNRFFYSSLTPSTSLNATTNLFLFGSPLTTTITVRKCAPLKDSRYEYFWDHVWEWIDVCLYAFIPFTVMSIGTFLIVYRVYYQQRRVFRSRRSGKSTQLGATPNKAKSLFYLLFTLNLLYFILVSPVVLVTTVLFRDPNDEIAYPRFKAIIYLMQYSNHSLNFIFYENCAAHLLEKQLTLNDEDIRKNIEAGILYVPPVIYIGITSPPYRKTLCEWFALIVPHLPACCQRIIRRHSKSNQTTAPTRQTNTTPQRRTLTQPERRKMTVGDEIVSPNLTVPTDGTASSHERNESILLLPK